MITPAEVDAAYQRLTASERRIIATVDCWRSSNAKGQHAVARIFSERVLKEAERREEACHEWRALCLQWIQERAELALARDAMTAEGGIAP